MTDSPTLPHKISTLIFAFNDRDEVLLMRRQGAPNAGLWSPFGGKLNRETGESPHQCAARETGEEIGLRVRPGDLHLAGMVAERAYEGNTHWLMFMFELKFRLQKLPPPHEEGIFEFVPLPEVINRPIPATDREVLWPLFLKNRGGFFSVAIVCRPDGRLEWDVEETLVQLRSEK
ncbi:MAG: NUDIX hydrolase [Verrucomicrobiae bacterium]|nr:NUDIX hydrolase [Verrucomicrobiae bacterium]